MNFFLIITRYTSFIGLLLDLVNMSSSLTSLQAKVDEYCEKVKNLHLYSMLDLIYGLLANKELVSSEMLFNAIMEAGYENYMREMLISPMADYLAEHSKSSTFASLGGYKMPSERKAYFDSYTNGSFYYNRQAARDKKIQQCKDAEIKATELATSAATCSAAVSELDLNEYNAEQQEEVETHEAVDQHEDVEETHDVDQQDIIQAQEAELIADQFVTIKEDSDQEETTDSSQDEPAEETAEETAEEKVEPSSTQKIEETVEPVEEKVQPSSTQKVESMSMQKASTQKDLPNNKTSVAEKKAAPKTFVETLQLPVSVNPQPQKSAWVWKVGSNIKRSDSDTTFKPVVTVFTPLTKTVSAPSALLNTTDQFQPLLATKDIVQVFSDKPVLDKKNLMPTNTDKIGTIMDALVLFELSKQVNFAKKNTPHMFEQDRDQAVSRIAKNIVKHMKYSTSYAVDAYEICDIGKSFAIVPKARSKDYSTGKNINGWIQFGYNAYRINSTSRFIHVLKDDGNFAHYEVKSQGSSYISCNHDGTIDESENGDVIRVTEKYMIWNMCPQTYRIAHQAINKTASSPMKHSMKTATSPVYRKKLVA